MNSKINIKTKRPIKKQKNWGSIHCGNCGELGHIYKKCEKPVQSLGIILYRIKKSVSEMIPPPHISPKSKYLFYANNLEFLLIRRRNSLGYMEFLRGKFCLSDINFLKSLFNEMTVDEHKNISTMTFTDMWTDLWLKTKDSKEKYKSEYTSAERKFNILKKGIKLDDGSILTINILLDTFKPKWSEAEWGFPKGRRNLREEDIKCACREFSEETGYISEDYELCSTFPPIEELFLGSNNVLYKHIYYIGKAITDKHPKIDPTNYCQSTEIGDISWFNYFEAFKKIREYCIEKRAVLTKTCNIIADS